MHDPVDRLTPLGLMVLTLLDEGDMHPYEMIRLMRQRRDDRFVTITNGTMYHTVARLEQAGLVAEVGTDRQGNRPERTTYTLTDAGRDASHEWVRRELSRIDRPDQFRVAIAEAHTLERAEVVDLLHARRTALIQSLEWYRDGRRAASDRDIPEQYLLELDRQQALLVAELHWLDDLVRRLEQHSFPWGDEGRPDHNHEYLLDRKAARL